MREKHFEQDLLALGLLSYATCEYTGFLHSGLVQNKVPDLQFYLVNSDVFFGDSPKLFNFNPDVSNHTFLNNVYVPYLILYRKVANSVQIKKEGLFPFTMIALILHPQSVGEIRLQSADPTVPPLIDPRYYHNEQDLDILVDGLKFLDLLAQTPPMQEYKVEKYEGPVAICSQFTQWSDEYVRCLARTRPLTIYHPVSTCRMGGSIEDSVVDSELR